MGGDGLLLSVHSQEGYGHGTGREEIRDRVEEFEGETILLKDEGAGEVYGGENMYDLVIEEDQLYGELDDEVASVIDRVYDEVELIGIYGCECVANTAESLDLDSVEINPEATVDQSFGSGEYLVSQVMEDDSKIGWYVDRFRDPEVADRIRFRDGVLEDFPEYKQRSENKQKNSAVTVDEEDEGVEILT